MNKTGRIETIFENRLGFILSSKRTHTTLVLPHTPNDELTVCVLGNAFSIDEMENYHCHTERDDGKANDPDKNFCSTFRRDVNRSFILLFLALVSRFVLFLQKHYREDDSKQSHCNNEDLYESHEKLFVLCGNIRIETVNAIVAQH